MGQPICCSKDPGMAPCKSEDGRRRAMQPSSGGGASVWVDNVEDLAAAFALDGLFGDGHLDHLYTLPAGGARRQALGALDELYLPRDVGVVRSRLALDPGRFVGLEIPWLQGDASQDRSSYACVQVDDLSNPWGLYAVAEGHGKQGGEISARLAAELPRVLLQHEDVYRNPCQALYEAYLAAGEAAAAISSSASRSTMGVALLRDGFLHVAWAGGAKVVLGRLAAQAQAAPPAANMGAGIPGTILRPASRRRPGAPPLPQAVAGPRAPAVAPPPILRAVDLMAPGEDASQGDREDFSSATLSEPEVRRMRLKEEDVCAILGTDCLWQWLSPEEVITIVGQRMTSMACDAADALSAEIRKRMVCDAKRSGIRGHASVELVAVVVYFAGSRYVRDFDARRAEGSRRLGTCFVSDGLDVDEGPCCVAAPAFMAPPGHKRNCGGTAC